MYTLSMHPLATKEYNRAKRWYRKRSVIAEERFRIAVQTLLTHLESSPEYGSPYCDAYLWQKTKRFPFILYYRIALPKTVVILALAHQKRRQGYWLRRDKSPF